MYTTRDQVYECCVRDPVTAVTAVPIPDTWGDPVTAVAAAWASPRTVLPADCTLAYHPRTACTACVLR